MKATAQYLSPLCLLAVAAFWAPTSVRAGTISSQLPEEKAQLRPNGRCFLERWNVIGPFEAQSNVQGLATNFLRDYGVGDEGTEIPTYISTLLGNKNVAFARGKSTGSPLLIAKKIVNKRELDLYTEFSIARQGDSAPSFYASTSIESPADTAADLILGSDAVARIWVNGSLVADALQPRKFDAEPYNSCFSIRLLKGENRILIKLVRVATSCALVAEIESDPIVATDALLAEIRNDLRQGTGSAEAQSSRPRQ
jgi:hypothetical protein